ncbi:MAG: hypothetical protein AAGJ35_08250, partial [Myxococcota bacterium]
MNSALGLRRAGPIKGNLPLCGALDVDPCKIAEIAEVAESLSSVIGAYMRVDMFLDETGSIRVQEYSGNHMGGYRHCSAKLDEVSGCVDPCFLGAMWNDAGGNAVYGGPALSLPGSLTGWAEASATDQCAAVVGTVPNPSFTSSLGECEVKPEPIATSPPTVTPTAGAEEPTATAPPTGSPVAAQTSEPTSMPTTSPVAAADPTDSTDPPTTSPVAAQTSEPTSMPTASPVDATNPTDATDPPTGSPVAAETSQPTSMPAAASPVAAETSQPTA